MYLFLIIAIFSLTIGHLFQVARWQQFITIYEKPNKRSLLQSLSFGYIFNFYLPFRIGDLFRAIYAGRKMKNGISFSLATVIIGRYLDVLFVGLLFIVFIFIGNFNQRIISSAIFYCLIALFVFILSIFFLKKNSFPKWMIRKFASIFNPQLELKILIFFWCFITAFKDMYLKTNRLKLLLNTLLMWVFYSLSYFMLALTINSWYQNDTEFLDVFLMLFAGGGMEINEIQFSMVFLNSNVFISIVFLFAPLLILLLLSFVFPKKSVIIEDESKYFNILPHKNKEDKLVFLEQYFATRDSGLIKKYIEITNDLLVLEDFSAGSNATTLLCYSENRNFYRKYVIGEDKDKLYHQVLWLDSLKDQLPVTQIYQTKLTDDYCYYDMEFNPAAMGLFNFIHSASLEDSWNLIQNTLETIRIDLHSAYKVDGSKNALPIYIETKVINNIKKIREHQRIKELLKFDKLIINGKSYHNLQFYLKYFSVEYLTSVFKDEDYCIIHGDLTVENIIVDPKSDRGFYLIDPNSENVHNVDTLDFAKLLQSLHGGYEFLMKTNKMTSTENEISFLFTKSARYEELFLRYKDYLKQHFEPSKVKRIFYHELIHWLRLLPYKLQKNGDRALLFYAGFIIVLNEIIDEFEKE